MPDSATEVRKRRIEERGRLLHARIELVLSTSGTLKAQGLDVQDAAWVLVDGMLADISYSFALERQKRAEATMTAMNATLQEVRRQVDLALDELRMFVEATHV